MQKIILDIIFRVCIIKLLFVHYIYDFIMFIKEIKKKNKNDGKTFLSHRLVESYRTPKGPRQRVILQLGKLELPREQWKSLANRIEEIANGNESVLFATTTKEVEALAFHYAQLLIKQKIRQKQSIPEKQEQAQGVDEPEYHTVDIKSVNTSTVRSIGAESVSLHAFKQLGFDKIFEEIGFKKRERELAMLAIIGRMVHPGSDLGTVEWARNISGLDELIGADFKRLGKNALYPIALKLYENKDIIDLNLQTRETDLFSLKRKIILYDLTNTFLEGSGKKSERAKYGRSKEKRTDCPLVTLGFVIDNQGFPLASKIFEGNQSEPASLRVMLEELQKTLPNAGKPTVIMDAGIASEANLNLIKEELDYDYLVVSKKKFDSELDGEELIVIKEDKASRIRAQLIKKEGEQILYCESNMRREKEMSMKSRFEKRFETALENIKSSLSKPNGKKNYKSIMERIGRAREKNKLVSHFYTIDVQPDEKGKNAISMSWEADKKLMEERFNGSYYLRTSRVDLSELEIWSLYNTLTNVEDSFRSMKSDLGLRPIYHQKDKGIEAHIYITVLAYHVLQTIRHQLRNHKIQMRWSRLRERLGTHVRVTTSFTNDKGERINIRNTSQPEYIHLKIYQSLNMPVNPLKTII